MNETVKSRARSVLLTLFVSLMATPAAAQEQAGEPPKGPAEIIQRARAGRERAAIKQAEQAGEAAAQQAGAPGLNVPPRTPEPANAPHSGTGVSSGTAPGETRPAQPVPTTDSAARGAPEGAPPQASAQSASSARPAAHPALAEPRQATAMPASDLAAGSIEVQVFAPDGSFMADADIVLGIMEGQGGRTEQRAKSDARGRYTFTGLATGSSQAYRVNVYANGAKFSSNPFRLPTESGYRVRIPVLETTKSDRMVFQLVGQTVVELRDDRLRITQQSRITNAGHAVYTLPEEGLLIPLPQGFTAFQWQEQMTDQKAVEEPGKGFRLRGSLPPGSVTLAWAFDLEREGDSAKIPVKMPFKTFSYRVISEAPPGLSLSATDFPAAERVKDQGRDLLYTQVQRGPGEPELGSFSIKLEGIPGPGPGRWVAALLAAFAMAWGLLVAFRPAKASDGARTILATRKQGLLAAAKQVEEEFARGDIGPEFHARRMDEITTELALILRDEESLGGAKA